METGQRQTLVPRHNLPMRLILSLLLLACTASAAVRSIALVERAPIDHGYERIVARVTFAVDPRLAANRLVRDLEFAATDTRGQVEFTSDLYVLRPRDPAKSNGTALFEVSNRGGKGMLSRFNYDDWLYDQGYTLVWLGWEYDIPQSNREALHFEAPHFRPEALPAAGLTHSEFVPSVPTTTMKLANLAEVPIAVDKPIALYMLDRTDNAPAAIARDRWNLAANGESVEMAAGFQPGKLYEFVYQGKDPVVVGAGLAAIRDWISFLKYGQEGVDWPGGHGATVRAIGFGISQSGRFLREFLYDGFNADERGRKVFDGVWADVAGAGRGSFNFRYAQPSRDGHAFLNVFYPTDLFPFTDAVETDPVTGKSDALLARARAANVAPKLFFTNNSYEYWGRAAALIHVTPDGKHDLALSPDTRFYFVAGVQHSPRALPLVKAGTRYLVNPVDHRPVQRALLAAMQAWLKDGTAPPASVYPTLAEGQLTALAGLKFPAIEGVRPPQYPRVARRLDFGAGFATAGIDSVEPPVVRGAFPVLVPQVDADGIDLGGIRLPELAVPLATITGWNLRAPDRGAPEEMAEFLGAFLAFPKTKEDRVNSHDPRLSIQERYQSRERYLQRVNAAADRLVWQRFVLPQDRERIVDRAAKLWDALM